MEGGELCQEAAAVGELALSQVHETLPQRHDTQSTKPLLHLGGRSEIGEQWNIKKDL